MDHIIKMVLIPPSTSVHDSHTIFKIHLQNLLNKKSSEILASNIENAKSANNHKIRNAQSQLRIERKWGKKTKG